MPIVVLTNDDGVHAPGLGALENALAELGEVYVVAPEREQSACGHALTLHRPLRPLRLGERRFLGPRRAARLGHRVYKEKIVEQADPRGRSHYWLGGGEARWDDLEGTDMGAVHDGYVSLTPLHLDLTNHRALVQLNDWQGGLNAQFLSETGRSPRRGPAPAATPKRKPRRG